MYEPATLIVSVPRSALPLDRRHQDYLSSDAFEGELRRTLSELLGGLVIAQTTDGDDFRIDPGGPLDQVIEIATLERIDAAIDELLSAPEVWRRTHGWAPSWDAPDPWEPWYQTGTAVWGEWSMAFDIAIRREPYALLVGYWMDGEPKRKWYRVTFPVERPSADAIPNGGTRSSGNIGRVRRLKARGDPIRSKPIPVTSYRSVPPAIGSQATHSPTA